MAAAPLDDEPGILDRIRAELDALACELDEMGCPPLPPPRPPLRLIQGGGEGEP